jgi:hypothetical protein
MENKYQAYSNNSGAKPKSVFTRPKSGVATRKRSYSRERGVNNKTQNVPQVRQSSQDQR